MKHYLKNKRVLQIMAISSVLFFTLCKEKKITIDKDVQGFAIILVQDTVHNAGADTLFTNSNLNMDTLVQPFGFTSDLLDFVSPVAINLQIVDDGAPQIDFDQVDSIKLLCSANGINYGKIAQLNTIPKPNFRNANLTPEKNIDWLTLSRTKMQSYTLVIYMNSITVKKYIWQLKMRWKVKGEF